MPDALEPDEGPDPEGVSEEEMLDVDDEPEAAARSVPAIVEVLQEDPSEQPQQRRRKVVRREGRPLSIEERRAIDDEIVKSNTELRRLEVEKAAVVKKYNGQIADQRQTLDDAIDVLGKDCIESDEIRIEVMDYHLGVVFYYAENGKDAVDERDMTEEEKQMKMDL